MNQRAARCKRVANDVRPGEGTQRVGGGLLDAVEIVRVGGKQDGLGVGIVFGLRQQVECGPRRRNAAVGDYHHLARTYQRVDANRAEHQPLCRRDEGAAGADDFVHLRHGFGAPRQGRDGLCAADGEHPVWPRDEQRRQQVIAARAGGCGGGDNHLADARNPGRNDGHERRRGIRGLPARHIDAHPV